jgi:hypothetical protein
MKYESETRENSHFSRKKYINDMKMQNYGFCGVLLFLRFTALLQLANDIDQLEVR